MTMITPVALCLALLICVSEARSYYASHVKQAFVIFRHGERTPLMTYPTDPYKDRWTRGLGQITQHGTEQAYALGQFIKRRYTGFISHKYQKDELTTLSSMMDRTLTAALSVLAGLYPPVDEQVWKNDLHWQPIPVRTTTGKTNWLFMTGFCPAYDKIVDGYLNSEEHINFTEGKKDLMEFLSEQTGTSISTLNLLDRFYDTMMILKSMNLNLPSFVNSTVFSQLEEVHVLVNSLFVNSLQQQRLKVGPIFENLQNFMQQSIQQQTKKKLILYSGNDRLITAILKGLNTSDIDDPDFTAALFIELYGNANNQSTIKIFYQESRNASVEEILIPSCPSPCSFAQFNDTISNLIPVNIIDECEVPVDTLKTFWKLGEEAPLSVSSKL